jgi:hypothetical protein
VAGQWFSPDTPVLSTNKTDRYDISKILLKVALNTIIPGDCLIEVTARTGLTVYTSWTMIGNNCHRQPGGFLWVLRFPPIKLTATTQYY